MADSNSNLKAQMSNRNNSSEASSNSASFDQPKMSAMAALMAKQKTQPVGIKRGDKIKGRITKLSKNEILMDISGKSEALVLERERRIMNVLLATLKVGDEVEAIVFSPESDAGQPVVTLRRFVENKSWDFLALHKKSQSAIPVTVSEVTKGGYIVVADTGTTGFLPQSHLSPSAQHLTPGKSIQVFVLELNKEDKKIIFTQKVSLTDEEFGKIKKAVKIGQKMSATVSNITPFGIFVSLPISLPDRKDPLVIDGLIHISELSWDKVLDITSIFHTGEKIEAAIIGFDNDAKRIDLSVKRFTADPFAEIVKLFPIDKNVAGTVKAITGGNVIIDLGNGVEGIIRKEKVPVNASYTVGAKINVLVADVDAKRHKISLAPVLLEKPIGYR